MKCDGNPENMQRNKLCSPGDTNYNKNYLINPVNIEHFLFSRG